MRSSKLTEIWYKGTLLYANYDFNVYFFKIFVINIFWANFVPKFSKLTGIWYSGTLLYAYYDFKVSFFKIIFIYIFWANLARKFEVLKTDRNFIKRYIAICL